MYTIIFYVSSIINNNNKDDNVYGAFIMASHFESSPGSYDEYGTASSGRQPSAHAGQTTWAVSPPVHAILQAHDE